MTALAAGVGPFVPVARTTSASSAAAVASRPPVEADSASTPIGISDDGRYALFTTLATNLAPEITPGGHLYRRDIKAGATELVDASYTGGPPDGSITGVPTGSGDGRYVVFASTATNLVPGDGGRDGGRPGAFLRDLALRTTEAVSVATDGTVANGWSSPAGVSEDGRYVLFQSYATNLLPGGTPPNQRNIYLRDRRRQTTELVVAVPDASIASGWSPWLSPDGLFAAYDLNVTSPFGGLQWTTIRQDLRTGATDVAGVANGGGSADAATYGVAVSRRGRIVVMNSHASNLVGDDTNGVSDVFVHDFARGTTERVSVTGDGSQANGVSIAGGVSDNGRYIVFRSEATNLVPDDTNGVTDIFLRDRQRGTTRLVSLAADGSQGDAESGETSRSFVSDGGRFVLFDSGASNLVPGDTNASRDVFVRDVARGTTIRVSVG